MSTLTTQGFQRDRLDVILNNLTAQAKSIFGADTVLDGSTQDGQWLGALAEGLDALLQIMEDVYNSFDPSAAVGTSLFRLGLLSGVVAKTGRQATIPIMVHVKQGETLYAGAQVQAGNGVIYATVTDIGPSASDSMPYNTTAQALLYGTPQSVAGSYPSTLAKVVDKFGWIDVVQTAYGTAGTMPEGQETFRIRRNASTGKPAQGIDDAMYAALLQLEVGDVHIFQNDTAQAKDIKPGDGALPSHSRRVLVKYDNALIPQVMFLYKSPGCTYIGAGQTFTDSQGTPQGTGYTVAIPTAIVVNITCKPLPGQGFDPTTGASSAVLATNLASWFNGQQGVGADVAWDTFFDAVKTAVPGVTQPASVKVTDITIGLLGGPSPAAQDLVMGWNQLASLTASNITVTVTT